MIVISLIRVDSNHRLLCRHGAFQLLVFVRTRGEVLIIEGVLDLLGKVIS
jgi:hypothetical protein